MSSATALPRPPIEAMLFECNQCTCLTCGALDGVAVERLDRGHRQHTTGDATLREQLGDLYRSFATCCPSTTIVRSLPSRS